MKNESSSPKVWMLCYYDDRSKIEQNRHAYINASVKIEEIGKALCRQAVSVYIVSPATTSNKTGIYPQYSSKTSWGANFHTFFTIGFHFPLFRKLATWFCRLQCFFYLLFRVRRSQTVIVYHSVSLMHLVSLLRIFKTFNLVLEVEDFYSNYPYASISNKKEATYLRKADRYIFSADSMKKMFDPNGQNSAFIYGLYSYFGAGSYSLPNSIVYAGGIDSKEGAYLALQACQYLDSSCQVDFLLFGSEPDKALFSQKFQEIQPKLQCRVTLSYSALFGSDFLSFLSSHQVGLACQIGGREYDKTSFPSKITAYLSCNLNVVVGKLPVVTESLVSNLMFYYENDSPQSIAETVKKALNTQKSDYSSFFASLNADFEKNLLRICSSDDI